MSKLMSTGLFKTTMTAAAVTALLAIPAQAETDATVEIKEWEVPWENSRPRDPWVSGPDTVWFVGQRSHYAATLTPSSGEFQRYDLPDSAGPHTVIADDNGAWYAGNMAQHIGLINAESGEIEQLELPGEGRRDAHTMAFTSDGDIWFTVQGGNQIGYLDTDTSEIELHDVATENARPYGIVVHEDQPWATLFGTNKLATVVDGTIQEIDLPREETRPRRIAVTSDDMVWYVDYAEGYVGRYNPDTEEVDEWRAPAGADSRPYGMSSDRNGMIWFVETGVQPNRFVGFDPETESFTDPVEIESGGGTVRHMFYDPATHSIWFGTDANTIAQAVIK